MATASPLLGWSPHNLSFRPLSTPAGMAPPSLALTLNCGDQTCAALTRSGSLTNAIIRTAEVEVAGGWQLPWLLSWGPGAEGPQGVN